MGKQSDLDTGTMCRNLRRGQQPALMLNLLYTEAVSSLEAIVENLKHLPPSQLDVVADFVQRLTPANEAERQAALDRTFGCMSLEEAGELERTIEEGCERIDVDRC